MTAINGHANDSASRRADFPREHASGPCVFGAPAIVQFSSEKIKEVIAELEVPFDPSVIEWRVTNTTKGSALMRGQVIPYADQRAYSDRLNALFTPAGWTRKYEIHTSANFQRDEKTVVKVFLSCELTIFGLGCHSATGEQWADDDNAGTSAEAQAFKRACSCFGLGRYLYYFTGIWVDLDGRKRPKTTLTLAGWATPQGWRQGQRPYGGTASQATKSAQANNGRNRNDDQKSGSSRETERGELIRQIEAMAETLGKGIYRGLLKTVARAWKPDQISDAALLRKVLAHMQSADRRLRRLQSALDKTGTEPLAAILKSFHVNSLEHVNDLETLHKIVVALEAKVEA